jgi:uncharacterized protein
MMDGEIATFPHYMASAGWAIMFLANGNCDRMNTRMDEDSILKRTEEFVKDKHSGDASGHDWWHIHRVSKMAVEIGKAEGVDLFVVQLAALLHDIDDYKLVGDFRAPHASPPASARALPEGQEPRRARDWLEELEVRGEVIDHVCQIIIEISFKGARVSSPMSTREGMVVQDADRLDAIGAIGIARAFAYGGARGRLIHDPEIEPVQHESFEQYKKSAGPTINHFYEKLLLLKDLMNTGTGRQIADARHQFMEQFLQEFFEEWNGSPTH